MTGRRGRGLAMALLCVGLLALVAVGGAAAVGPDDYCGGDEVGENESVVFGGVGDTASSGETAIYAGSTLTVGYCEDGEPADSGWLENGSGFEIGDPNGHLYTVSITGEADSIDFTDNMTDGQASVDEGLAVTVVRTPPTAQSFFTDVRDTENETTNLTTTTSAIEAGNGNFTGANATIYSLKADYETMTETRAALLNRLQSNAESGNETGTVATAAAVDSEYQRVSENVTEATNAYASAVDTRANGPRSTVQLSVFGSLGAGVALGLVVGAAVPLVAARRVKEKMKLSRDVSYDRKTALLPILVGVAAAVAGGAILAVMVGLDPLLRVIV